MLVSPGTYVESLLVLDLNKTLYFRSTSGASNTFLSGGNSIRLLRVENGPNGDPNKYLVFDGFTFYQGRGDSMWSPVTLYNTKAAFLNCRFMNCSSPVAGGAVLVAATAAHPGYQTRPVFANCLFQDNLSEGYGGAVLVNGRQCYADFKNCEFRNNSNRTPGAFYQIQGGALMYAEGNGVVDSCTFINNSTYYTGGAIMLLTWWDSDTSSVIIRNSRFEGNYCQEGATPIDQPTEGGAIMAENNFEVTILGCSFSNNWAEAGGAVHSYRAGLAVRRSAFEDNRALGAMAYGNPVGYGGGVGMRCDDTGDINRPEASLIVEDSLFRRCSGPSGGGIFFQGDPGYGRQGVISLNRVTIEECQATGVAGGPGHSGAIHLHVANMTANAAFLVRNRADLGGGGAITLDQDSTMTINDSFLIGNNALLNPDIYNPYSMPFSLNNTILAYNGTGPGANAVAFAAIPRYTILGCAFMSYFLSPYGSNPRIDPDIGGIPDRGGYATGTARHRPPTDVDLGAGTSTYWLTSSSYPTQRADITHSYKGLVTAAYPSQPVRLPGRVEGENFDQGGQGGGYNDISSANDGGSYRTTEGVDIVPGGSGRIVGWVYPGEWMEYILNVSTSGIYDLAVSVAAPAVGGSFYVQIDNADRTGVVDVPNTGGWYAFQPVSRQGIYLNAGLRIMRFVAVSAGFNLDYFDWTWSPVDPLLALDRTSISRTFKQGRTNSAGFRVRNSGAGTLYYEITNDAPWLTCVPTNGTSAGEWDTITCRVDASGLETGTYNAVIAVLAPDATNAPRQIAMTLRVVPNRNVRCDFDGDLRTDFGVYRPSDLTWYISRSSQGAITYTFGMAGDIPVPADYDGDGVSDVGIFRPSTVTWYIFRSSLGTMAPFQYGTVGDLPAPGDYDGDGRADLAIYRPSDMTWYIYGSTRGFFTLQFGAPGDIPAPADYDGDLRDDHAVYRPAEGMWYVWGSVSGAMSFAYGAVTDLPVPGDYNGDGVLDRGVFRPSTSPWMNSTWHIRRSGEGWTAPIQYGAYGDQPLR